MLHAINYLNGNSKLSPADIGIYLVANYLIMKVKPRLIIKSQHAHNWNTNYLLNFLTYNQLSIIFVMHTYRAWLIKQITTLYKKSLQLCLIYWVIKLNKSNFTIYHSSNEIFHLQLAITLLCVKNLQINLNLSDKIHKL